MPELPEVETVAATLRHQLQGVEIQHVSVLWDNIIAEGSVEEFKKRLVGQSFQDFHRHGKYIIFELNNYFLVSHLRMEGKYFYDEEENIPHSNHNHIFFRLANGKVLVYHDVRKFGKLYLYDKSIPILERKAFKNSGIDAMDPKLDGMYLYHELEGKSKVLKAMLLDQNIIAGIGNIYADEICFLLHLYPGTYIANYSIPLCDDIIEATRIVLSKAIAEGGTTIRSYTSSLGISGRFQLYLNVHMREHQACHICQSEIVKVKVVGRGTYFCPVCQPYDY